MKTLTRSIAILLLLSAAPAFAAGVPPWRFGMSRAEVASVKEAGPYKDFSNGDVETFNGRFGGRKENIQFFFQGDRLRRIGVYMFQGTDPQKGIPAWQRAYERLQKDYGKVALPDLQVAPKSDPVGPQVLAIAAAAHADATGQTLRMPAKQPNDIGILGRFWTANVQGKK